jgi:hypothetical protein
MSWKWARLRPGLARVLISLVTCGLAVACTTSGSGPDLRPGPASGVKVTGYRSVSLSGTSGAVTVALPPAGSRHILGLVRALRQGSGPDCEEPPDLVYRVTVDPAAGAARGTVISGYQCSAAVSVTIRGSGLSWYTDAGCRLDQAIRRLVPVRAEGTRQAGVGC